MTPVQFYKCLADETRAKCLMLISHEKELCVCELTEALQASQPKVSRHLAQLREYGLLKDRREGQWIFYSINPALPEWAVDVINLTTQKNMPFIKNNLKLLKDFAGRPERTQVCC